MASGIPNRAKEMNILVWSILSNAFFPVEENEVQGVIALFRKISKTSDAVKLLSSGSFLSKTILCVTNIFVQYACYSGMQDSLPKKC